MSGRKHRLGVAWGPGEGAGERGALTTCSSYVQRMRQHVADKVHYSRDGLLYQTCDNAVAMRRRPVTQGVTRVAHPAISVTRVPTDKYKIHKMPPPYECGPPMTIPAGSYGGSANDLYGMAEHPDEGEGAESGGGGGLASPQLQPILSAAAASEHAVGGSELSFSTAAMAAVVGSRSGGTEEGADGSALVFSVGEAAAGQQAAVAVAVVAEPAGPFSGAGSALAASLQSGLSRMLSRATGNSQQAAEQQAAGGGGATAGSTAGGSVPAGGLSSLASSVSTTAAGASPRGSSPTPMRGHASGGSSSSRSTSPLPASVLVAAGGGPASRLARLLGGGDKDKGSGAESGERSQPGLAGGGSGPVAVGGGGGGGSSSSSIRFGSSPVRGRGVERPEDRDRQQQERQQPETFDERRRREACAVYGERWAARVKRIQKESPHGRRAGWALRCVIVKSGDDCRQVGAGAAVLRRRTRGSNAGRHDAVACGTLGLWAPWRQASNNRCRLGSWHGHGPHEWW